MYIYISIGDVQVVGLLIETQYVSKLKDAVVSLLIDINCISINWRRAAKATNRDANCYLQIYCRLINAEIIKVKYPQLSKTTPHATRPEL